MATTLPNVQVRTLVAEPHPDGIMTMTEGGDIAVYLTPELVVRHVRRRDAEALRLTGTSVATVIEWRGMPEGWEVPA